nr:hypothetical protein CFP56_69090 [Quercus suber]
MRPLKSTATLLFCLPETTITGNLLQRHQRVFKHVLASPSSCNRKCLFVAVIDVSNSPRTQFVFVTGSRLFYGICLPHLATDSNEEPAELRRVETSTGPSTPTASPRKTYGDPLDNMNEPVPDNEVIQNNYKAAGSAESGQFDSSSTFNTSAILAA